MAVLTGRNIQLRPVEPADLELLRTWRNSDDIRNCHIYRKKISFDEQQQWFAKVTNTDTDYFFVIEKSGKKYGIVKVQDIDWKRKEGHAGIFIADPGDRRSSVSVEAALLAAEFFFNTLGLQKLTAMVLAVNAESTAFVEKLGVGVSVCKDVCIDGRYEKVHYYSMTAGDYARNLRNLCKRFLKN